MPFKGVGVITGLEFHAEKRDVRIIVLERRPNLISEMTAFFGVLLDTHCVRVLATLLDFYVE
jgi:hypothetical protein